MIHLSPITIEARALFLWCVDRIRDPDVKKRLEDISDNIARYEGEFANAGASASFFKIVPHDSVGGNVSRAEMISVYDQQMVPAISRGRVYYDSIMRLAKHRRCPICDFGQVSSLDHYLPKAHFPGLAMCPANLLPSCADCNKRKSSAFAKCASKQTLNPYFDDITCDLWLHAQFKPRTPIVVEFSVRKVPGWSRILASRVRHHFDTFRLSQTYSMEAAIELDDLRESLPGLLTAGGKSEVQQHLADEANKRSRVRLNSWRAALYRALAASDWFCREGCLG